VQGYVTWLGEMKFSPSTINQRLAAICKLATEAQRCGYVDSEMLAAASDGAILAVQFGVSPFPLAP
jgi:hypothetical protein